MELIDKAALVAEIERMLKKEYPCDNSEQETGYDCALYELQDFLNTLEVKEVGEPSKDLEEAARKVGQKYFPDENNIWARPNYEAIAAANAFKEGAKWQEENLWKPADGDDLPEINREVIALIDNGMVVFAHRPPEYWDGKNILTGKVTRHEPKRYDKGGWNIPDVKWWLDLDLPKMQE